MSNVDIDRLSGTIRTQLNTYSRTITTRIGEAAEATVKEMVAETKKRPRGRYTTGAYARAIASQVGENSIHAQTRIWYVKAPHYRITHLINNGHAVRGGRRYAGDKHVTRATDHAIERFETRVREVIENASN